MNVELRPKASLCFMYWFKSLGVSPKEIAASLNYMYMDIYRWEDKGRQPRISKCPWCGEKIEELEAHLKSHGKSIDSLRIRKMQDALYRELMKKVKEDKNNYFSHVFLFGSSCQYCIKPLVKGRKGMCALPESARNKMRSLRTLGFKSDNFDPEWLSEEFMGGIAYG